MIYVGRVILLERFHLKVTQIFFVQQLRIKMKFSGEVRKRDKLSKMIIPNHTLAKKIYTHKYFNKTVFIIRKIIY